MKTLLKFICPPLLSFILMPYFASAGTIENKINIQSSTGGNIINGNLYDEANQKKIENRAKIKTVIDGIIVENLDVSGERESSAADSEIKIESRISANDNKAKIETQTEINGKKNIEKNKIDIKKQNISNSADKIKKNSANSVFLNKYKANNAPQTITKNNIAENNGVKVGIAEKTVAEKIIENFFNKIINKLKLLISMVL